MPPKKIADPTEKSYFQQRMELLGITPEINKIALNKTELQTGKPILEEVPIFTEVEKGIKILVYTLDRCSIRIEKANSRIKEDFAMTRLKDPIISKKGDVIKYLIPKGVGTQPFFPPSIIEKFEQKIPMKTIFLTEGYFKAFKAAMHGLDIIGLSSITHMKDRETGKLHGDILKLVNSGLVERFVWLTDGDCLDISSKELTDEKDLAMRPRNFFSTVNTFKNLLDDYDHVEKWFMHIDTDAIVSNYKSRNITRDMVKGIDDLLCTFQGEEAAILEDARSVSGSAGFFKKMNVTFGTKQVYDHFNLSHVDLFYLFHVGRRPELKEAIFKFNGTLYKYNQEDGHCVMQTPKEANIYFRVGDHYYKWIDKPNQWGKTERIFEERKKTTITDDHGKDICKHIPKYESFCNVPNHLDFQPIINNCFNVYAPLDIIPDDDETTPEDFPCIMGLICHIFGDKVVGFREKETGESREYSMLDLGMDYIQLLYHRPQQKMPILCLVSRENSTGKTTFGNFLRMMLGANVAFVGNQDMAGDFNAHWATKSLVIVDEAKIDKLHVIEKIKALSTAQKIFMNAKGKGQVELDCFIKFILITNNEDNFIYATEDDIRYWVLKVHKLNNDNPTIMENLLEELPAFMSWLNRRKMVTEMRSRMWFHPELLVTEALRKVQQFSEPTILKELRAYMKEMFLDTDLDEILMTQDAVHKTIFNGKYEKNYLNQILKDRLKLHQFHVWSVMGVDNKEFATRDEALAAASIKYPDAEGMMLQGYIKPKYKVRRFSYPSYQEVLKDGKRVRERVMVNEPPGRPYVFPRDMFVSKEEREAVIYDAEATFENELAISSPSKPEGLPF